MNGAVTYQPACRIETTLPFLSARALGSRPMKPKSRVNDGRAIKPPPSPCLSAAIRKSEGQTHSVIAEHEDTHEGRDGEDVSTRVLGVVGLRHDGIDGCMGEMCDRAKCGASRSLSVSSRGTEDGDCRIFGGPIRGILYTSPPLLADLNQRSVWCSLAPRRRGRSITQNRRRLDGPAGPVHPPGGFQT